MSRQLRFPFNLNVCVQFFTEQTDSCNNHVFIHVASFVVIHINQSRFHYKETLAFSPKAAVDI